MPRSNIYMLIVLISTLSGCFSIENSQWFVSRAVNLPEEFVDHMSGNLPFVDEGVLKVYIKPLKTYMGSQCFGGVLFIPSDAKITKGDVDLSNQVYIEIGIKVDASDVAIDLSRMKIIYEGRGYAGSESRNSISDDSNSRTVNLEKRDQVYWFGLFYPVKIDARSEYVLDVDGVSVNGKYLQKKSVKFVPVSKSEMHNYGERGC